MDGSTDEIRVLHVDDETEFLAVASERLERADEGLSVETEDDPIAALDRLADVDCVVSDYQMPGLDGLRFLEAVREDYPALPFILFTGEGSEEVAADAVSAGATDYLQKRPGTEQYVLLANRVRKAVERVSARRAAREANGDTDEADEADVDWYCAVVDTMAEGVYVLDEDYRMRFVNYRIGDNDAVSVGDWVGKPLSYLAETGVLSDAEVGAIEAGVDSIEDGDADEVRVELEPGIVPEADVVELRLTLMAVDGEDLVLGTTRDVSDRLEREAKLQRTTERYRTLIDNFPNGGVFTFDGDLRFTLAGGEGLSTVGLSADDLEGATPHAVFPDDVAEELETYYRAALDGEQHTFEQSMGGNHYRVHTLPIGDEDVDAGMAVSQNVIERKEHQRELERQNERLEEFTSVVSHDLRNPLTVLRGALELAERTGEAEHFERGERAVDRMERLVTDLRTLARQGDRVTDLEAVALPDVIQGSWDTVETDGAALAIDVNATILADESRLRQLLENLFRNAVEHGSTSPPSQAPEDAVEHGGSGVTVRVGPLDDGLYVADDGPGIAPEEREHVFESGYSSSADGTGFGLAIVSEIASAHGWNVDVCESDEGGAQFEVTGVELVE
jgi:PAS domain S-box-containing protein